MPHPIYEYRQANQLTLDELGLILKVKKSYLSKLERGERGITVERAVEWETITGIDWQKLVLFGVKQSRKRVIKTR